MNAYRVDGAGSFQPESPEIPFRRMARIPGILFFLCRFSRSVDGSQAAQAGPSRQTRARPLAGAAKPSRESTRWRLALWTWPTGRPSGPTRNHSLILTGKQAMKRPPNNRWMHRFCSSFTSRKRRRAGNRNILQLESLESRQMFSGVPWVPIAIAKVPCAEVAATVPAAQVTAAADAGAAQVPGQDSPHAVQVTLTAESPAQGESLSGESGGVSEGNRQVDNGHNGFDGLDGRLFDKLPDFDIFQELGEIDRLMQGLDEAFAFPDLKEGLPGQPSGPTVEGLEQLVWVGGRSEFDLRFGSDFSARGAVGDQHSHGAEPRGRGIGSDPRVGECVAEGLTVLGNGIVFIGSTIFTMGTCTSTVASGGATAPACYWGAGVFGWSSYTLMRSMEDFAQCSNSNEQQDQASADTPDSGADSSGNDSQSNASSSDSGNDSQSNAPSSDSGNDSQSNASSGSEQSEESNRATNDDTDDTDESTTHSQSEEREREEGRSNDSQDNQKGGKGCPPKGGQDDYGYDSRLPNPGSGSEPGGPNPFDQARVGQGNPEEHNHSGLTPIEAGTRRGTPLTTLDVTGQPGEAPSRSLTGRTFSLDPVVNPGKHS